MALLKVPNHFVSDDAAKEYFQRHLVEAHENGSEIDELVWVIDDVLNFSHLHLLFEAINQSKHLKTLQISVGKNIRKENQQALFDMLDSEISGNDNTSVQTVKWSSPECFTEVELSILIHCIHRFPNLANLQFEYPLRNLRVFDGAIQNFSVANYILDGHRLSKVDIAKIKQIELANSSLQKAIENKEKMNEITAVLIEMEKMQGIAIEQNEDSELLEDYQRCKKRVVDNINKTLKLAENIGGNKGKLLKIHAFLLREETIQQAVTLYKKSLSAAANRHKDHWNTSPECKFLVLTDHLAILSALKFDELIDIVPRYSSVLVEFTKCSVEDLYELVIKSLLAEEQNYIYRNAYLATLLAFHFFMNELGIQQNHAATNIPLLLSELMGITDLSKKTVTELATDYPEKYQEAMRLIDAYSRHYQLGMQLIDAYLHDDQLLETEEDKSDSQESRETDELEDSDLEETELQEKELLEPLANDNQPPTSTQVNCADSSADEETKTESQEFVDRLKQHVMSLDINVFAFFKEIENKIGKHQFHEWLRERANKLELKIKQINNFLELKMMLAEIRQTERHVLQHEFGGHGKFGKEGCTKRWQQIAIALQKKAFELLTRELLTDQPTIDINHQKTYRVIFNLKTTRLPFRQQPYAKKCFDLYNFAKLREELDNVMIFAQNIPYTIPYTTKLKFELERSYILYYAQLSIHQKALTPQLAANYLLNFANFIQGILAGIPESSSSSMDYTFPRRLNKDIAECEQKIRNSDRKPKSQAPRQKEAICTFIDNFDKHIADLAKQMAQPKKIDFKNDSSSFRP